VGSDTLEAEIREGFRMMIETIVDEELEAALGVGRSPRVGDIDFVGRLCPSLHKYYWRLTGEPSCRRSAPGSCFVPLDARLSS
jgi:hypothetical protein